MWTWEYLIELEWFLTFRFETKSSLHHPHHLCCVCVCVCMCVCVCVCVWGGGGGGGGGGRNEGNHE